MISESRLLINCTSVGNNLDNDVVYESVIYSWY